MNEFKTGDLVHIPSGSYRMKVSSEKDQYRIPFSANILTEPLIGVFKEPIDNTTSVVVFHDGEWIVENSCVYSKLQGENNVGTSEYKQSGRHMAAL